MILTAKELKHALAITHMHTTHILSSKKTCTALTLWLFNLFFFGDVMIALVIMTIYDTDSQRAKTCTCNYTLTTVKRGKFDTVTNHFY
jgi:hypothetical protein